MTNKNPHCQDTIMKSIKMSTASLVPINLNQIAKLKRSRKIYKNNSRRVIRPKSEVLQLSMLARTQTPLIQIQTEAAPSRNKSWKANISRKASKARTLSDRRRSKLSQSKVELRILNPLVLSRKNWTTYSQLNRCKMTKNPPTRKRLKIPSKSKNNPMAREG